MFDFVKHNQPKHITDDEILGWILDGSLVITNLDDPRPVLTFRERVIQPYLNQQGGRNYQNGASRWRWKLRNGAYKKKGKRIEKQRNIVCSKLVWMFVSRMTVPDGSRIHHLNEREGADSKCDAQWNLACMTYLEHQEYHYGTEDDF